MAQVEMTVEEAWRIIDACKDWNTSERSLSFAFDGVRTEEDDMLDAKRAALRKAWQVVGGNRD